MLRPDPPIPPDGACAECGGERISPKRGKLHNRDADVDPFCSTECARVWHGVPLPPVYERPPRGYVTARENARA